MMNTYPTCGKLRDGGRSRRRSRECSTSSRGRRTIVRRLKRNNGASYRGTTGAVGAVTDAVVEVDVAAQTGRVVGAAAKSLVLSEHVAKAGLLRRGFVY